MPDREMTAKFLEPILECAKQEKWGGWIETLENAIELLTQPPAPVTVLMVTARHSKPVKHGRCPACDKWINSVSNRTCCGYCGKMVSW